MQVLQYAEAIFTQDEPVDGLVQGRRNSSALALKLSLSCTNPSQ